ncbi:hypothetical protein UA00_01884 [Streptococcus gordonii]|nr:hypothetical protein UA00_01884 [Streptococcus gordonii]
MTIATFGQKKKALNTVIDMAFTQSFLTKKMIRSSLFRLLMGLGFFQEEKLKQVKITYLP